MIIPTLKYAEITLVLRLKRSYDIFNTASRSIAAAEKRPIRVVVIGAYLHSCFDRLPVVYRRGDSCSDSCSKVNMFNRATKWQPSGDRRGDGCL